MKTEPSAATPSNPLISSKGYPRRVKRLVSLIKGLRGLNRLPNRPSRPQKEGEARDAYDQHWGQTPDKAVAHFFLNPLTFDESRRTARSTAPRTEGNAAPTDSIRY